MIVSLHRNLDLLRLRLLLLRQVHLQDTVLHPGGDLLPVNRGGQREGAMEGTVQPFDPVVAFLLYLLLDLSLPPQREDAILDLDADGILVHAGNLRPDADRVLGFIDVHGRHPNAGSQCFVAGSSSPTWTTPPSGPFPAASPPGSGGGAEEDASLYMCSARRCERCMSFSAACFRTFSSSDFIDSFASETAASTSAARSAGTLSRVSPSVFSLL